MCCVVRSKYFIKIDKISLQTSFSYTQKRAYASVYPVEDGKRANERIISTNFMDRRVMFPINKQYVY